MNQDRTLEDVGQLYGEKGIGSRTGFGKRPAVLVVDMSKAFNDPEHPLGADQDSTVTAIARLLVSARKEVLPIYFTTTAYDKNLGDAGMFGEKIPALYSLKVDDPATEVDPRLAPLPNEPVILKKYASSFFGTNLLSLLQADNVDTLIITGCSTSGCIRAAAIDGVSYGFRIVVPEECVSDRAQAPHVANLFDIDSKYGDVMLLSDVISHLENTPLFNRKE